MDPQNHRAAQAPHKANIDTVLNRWLRPETFLNDDTKFHAIKASNRHAENYPTQHFVHGDQVDMHHAWEIKARENLTPKLAFGALPQPLKKCDELQKH